MLALLARMPPLNRGLTMVLLSIAGFLLLSLAVWAVLELLLGGTADLALRVTGHQAPRKSAARTAIDQLEERLRDRL